MNRYSLILVGLLSLAGCKEEPPALQWNNMDLSAYSGFVGPGKSERVIGFYGVKKDLSVIEKDFAVAAKAKGWVHKERIEHQLTDADKKLLADPATTEDLKQAILATSITTSYVRGKDSLTVEYYREGENAPWNVKVMFAGSKLATR